MTEQESATASGEETFDVLIVGAGISGIGSAYHLQAQCSDSSYVILESQESFGGTWLTHQYPGIRSDSDLYTYGYSFKPWTGVPIASGEAILQYMGEVIEENDIGSHIRYGHEILTARWSSATQDWTLEVRQKSSGKITTFKARFLWMCQGYYRHAEGYTPHWEGVEDYRGTIVHPQTWPSDLDCKGKSVIVIGSGATAATLIPALADDCGHITMLQRSPTYFFAVPNSNELANTLRELEIPDEWTHEIVRRKLLKDGREVTRRSFRDPEAMKQELIESARQYLGQDFDVAKHFTPSYRPWRQRIAVIPDGDLFQGIADGKASVVTDEIVRFTEHGIQLKSGDVLEADIIVTATGFDLCLFGDINFFVDDRPIDFSKTVGYRGMMFTGVPNMAWVFGYFRTSWTVRVDLVARFITRLLNHMEEHQLTNCTPQLRAGEERMPLSPWVDTENFNPGYLLRSLHLMPKQGDRDPWTHTQDYFLDLDQVAGDTFDSGALAFDKDTVTN